MGPSQTNCWASQGPGDVGHGTGTDHLCLISVWFKPDICTNRKYGYSFVDLV